MLRKSQLSLALLLSLAAGTATNAEDSNDKILAELQALREQVTQLEARIDALEEQPAPATTQKAPPRENKRWFDNMRVELKKAEVRASGPWVEPSNWTGIKTGLKVDEVIAILGEPTLRKFSVRRDTDEILIYQGDLSGDGEPINGEIRIYKGKVRRFTSPDFPE